MHFDLEVRLAVAVDIALDNEDARAGSLDVAHGVQLVDTPEFPDKWKAIAEGAR